MITVRRCLPRKVRTGSRFYPIAWEKEMIMDQVNRRSALALGAAALAGVAALSVMPGAASAEEHHYRYEKIHQAAVALHAAREEIEHAGHNFGGEKEKALEAIDNAIKHLERLRDWH
jgi:hypothetical protein